MKKIEVLESKMIPLSMLQANTGQVPGLPANPRKISKEKLAQLRQSIKKDPEMLSLREILVYPFSDSYIVVGGNQRLQALSGMAVNDVPCKIIPSDATPEQLRAYLIKDNVAFGSWVDEMLTSEWDMDELVGMGMDEVKDMVLHDDSEEQYVSHVKENPVERIPVSVPETPVIETPTTGISVIEKSRVNDTKEVQVHADEQVECNSFAEHKFKELLNERVYVGSESTKDPGTTDDKDASRQQESVIDEQRSVVQKPKTSMDQVLVLGKLVIPLSSSEAESLIRKANAYQSEHHSCCGLLLEILG